MARAAGDAIICVCVTPTNCTLEGVLVSELHSARYHRHFIACIFYSGCTAFLSDTHRDAVYQLLYGPRQMSIEHVRQTRPHRTPGDPPAVDLSRAPGPRRVDLVRVVAGHSFPHCVKMVAMVSFTAQRLSSTEDQPMVAALAEQASTPMLTSLSPSFWAPRGS